LLLIADIDSAEHLAATHTPALIALGITYDWVHCGGWRHAAWTVNHRNSADFDFVHFLFSCLCLYARIFPPRLPASAAIFDPVRPYLSIQPERFTEVPAFGPEAPHVVGERSLPDALTKRSDGTA
jgi:hypothetical protein